VRLVLPESVWESLLDQFGRQRPGVERIAFLDGYRLGEDAVVTTLTIPDATCEPGYYTGSPDQMREAGAHFRRYGMVRLAQVHTHGGFGLHHSGRDDQMAYSQREGAISIVLPEHAVRRPRPTAGLVHVRTTDSWRPLATGEAADLIVLVPSALDFRRETWTPSPRATKSPFAAWSGRWMRRLLSPFRWRSRRK
jgi:hypothetical protein